MNWQDLMLDNYGTPAIELVRGQGCTVWDASGKNYTDLLAGIAVSSLGHAHPNIVDAVQKQVGELAHTSNLYGHPQGLELAQRLRKYAPDHRAFFCNSGTEANEAALKLVRRHAHATGRPGGVVLAFENGFHGRSTGALALTGKPQYQADFGPLPGQIVHIPYNDIAALHAAFAGHQVVGVFLEVVQGEGGVVPLDPDVAAALRAHCAGSDALLVVDEVQTGVGRTGRFFAFEHYNLQPDVITLAKGLGGGLPIGATLIHERVCHLMPPGSHGSTFGGNPISCAAANAVIDTIESEGLLEHVQAMADALESMLDDAGLDHRGLGLLQGIMVPDAAQVVPAAAQEGVLLGTAGDVVRLAPPLIVSSAELRRGVAAIAKAAGVTVAPVRSES